jgi:hypothetical protein
MLTISLATFLLTFFYFFFTSYSYRARVIILKSYIRRIMKNEFISKRLSEKFKVFKII